MQRVEPGALQADTAQRHCALRFARDTIEAVLLYV